MNSDALLKPAPKGIERRPVTTASRLLMGGPVALVTSRYRGQTNVMPLAWHMPISSDPPLIAIAIEQSRYSVEMIDHSEEFALNIPKRPLLHHVQYLGALRGENIDKLEAAQLAHFAPSRITAPLIEGCAAWIEAGVRHQLPFGDHVLYVAEVMAVHVDPASFSDRWRTDVEDDRPLTFLGGNHYSSLSREQNARPPRDLDAPERVLAERMAEDWNSPPRPMNAARNSPGVSPRRCGAATSSMFPRSSTNSISTRPICSISPRASPSEILISIAADCPASAAARPGIETGGPLGRPFVVDCYRLPARYAPATASSASTASSSASALANDGSSGSA